MHFLPELGWGGVKWREVGVPVSSDSQAQCQHYYYPQQTDKIKASKWDGGVPMAQFSEGPEIGARAPAPPAPTLSTPALPHSLPASHFSLMSRLFNNRSRPFMN